jgi:hypothetical protein
MKSSSFRSGIITALIALAGACSPNDSGNSSGSGGHGSGGRPATGGSAGSGGAVGSGGTSASGGSNTSGGSVGSGGTSASGGSNTSGGSIGSGGTSASQGSGGAATGGSSSSGGATGTGGHNDGGTNAGGNQGSGGSSSGTATGGSTGSGGTTGAGGTTVERLDSSAGDSLESDAAKTEDGAIDAPVSDTGSDDALEAIDAPADANQPYASETAIDGSRWSEWNAFFPLSSGSTTNGDPGTTPDVSGHGFFASYGSGLSFSNSAMAMSGSGDVSIPPSAVGPVIDLTGSYSVSAWVKMTDTSNWRTFVSADGNQVSEFYLQKRSDTNQFGFTLSTSDTNDGVSAPCVASSSSTPDADTLYHLVATRDATTGLDTLYVNGSVAGTKTCLASDGVGWASTTFGIGHGMYSGSNVDYLSGSISGVGLIGRVLTASEVAVLFALGPG